MRHESKEGRRSESDYTASFNRMVEQIGIQAKINVKHEAVYSLAGQSRASGP